MSSRYNLDFQRPSAFGIRFSKIQVQEAIVLLIKKLVIMPEFKVAGCSNK